MSKPLWIVAATAWIMLSLIYYESFHHNNFDDVIMIETISSQEFNETSEYLIDTPGCQIPNYAKTMKFKETPNLGLSCGSRAVFIEKISLDSILFRIDWKKLKKYYAKDVHNVSCCYRTIIRSREPSKEDSEIIYSSCTTFNNGTIAPLTHEVIRVTCSLGRIIYEDSYIILKKVGRKIIDENKQNNWNVLIIGMDTMSRGRAYSSMRKTVAFFKRHKWLDYRGYQKVAFNTFPNLMALLTGKNISTVYRTCKPSMDDCRHLMLWNKFTEAGYVTAYGEDFLHLPDTFSHYGFKIPPTDHYMRPFFLTGERSTGNIVCAHTQTSASSILEYAQELTQTYKDERFFGLFWINSYSHNKFNTPVLFDEKIVEFLEQLEHNVVLNNTFIVFLSDHGIRYGKLRFSLESYYEERLPMLFMWVPHMFRKQYGNYYRNLQLNQNRLTSHLDLHMTLWDILKITNKSVDVEKSEACPTCKSLFEIVSYDRKCEDAGVNEKWCTCHQMQEDIVADDPGGRESLQLAISDIQNKSKNIITMPCAKCSSLTLKSVIRTHFYKDFSGNITFYVLAFLMSPGDVAYETKIMKDGNSYRIVESTETISEYNTRGNCVKNKNDRPYCVCEKLPNCLKT